MAGIQLSGLSSGLDTNSIVQALMSTEQQQRTLMTYRQAADQARQSAYQTIQTKLRALQSASDALGSVGTWAPTQTATSTDSTKVAATLTSGAAPGGYSITVSSLATSSQHTYTYAAQATDQTVTINGVAVMISANSSVDAAAAAINATQGVGVVAVNVGGSLVLASTATGSTSDFAVTGAGAMLTEQTNQARVGTNAQFSVNGGATQSSASNTVTAATVDPTTGQPVTGFPVGVQLTLNGVTSGTTVNVTAPSVDQSAVTSAVTSFVSAYNDATSYIQGLLTQRPIANPQSTSDAQTGVLYGDLGLQSLLDQLRLDTGSPLNVAANPSTIQMLPDIGISTGATTGGGAYSQDAVDGKLVLDSTKLSQALSSDPASVQRLLGAMSGTSGFAQTFDDALNPYTEAGGILDSNISSAGDDVRSVTDQIANWDEQMQLKQQELQDQFTQMETALATLKNQGAAFTSQLTQLPQPTISTSG